MYICTFICVCIYLFLYQFICWQTSYFYILALMTNATRNMGAQIPLQGTDFISFGFAPRSKIAGFYGSFIFIFWETCKRFSIVVAPTMCKVPFPLNSHQHLSSPIDWLIDCSYLIRSEVILRSWFALKLISGA